MRAAGWAGPLDLRSTVQIETASEAACVASQQSLGPTVRTAGTPDHSSAGRIASELFGRLALWSAAGVQRDAAFLVRCTSAALLYLTQIVLARWMGTTEYGIYVFVWTCVLLLGGLAHVGLNPGIIRLITVHREAADGAAVRGLVHGGRIAAFAIGTLVAGISYGAISLVQMYGGVAATGHVAASYWHAATLALLCVPLYAMTEVQDGIGRAHGWMGLALIPPYVLRPFLILACMAGAFWLELPMEAATAAKAAVIATWISGMIQCIAINRHLAVSYGRGPQSYRPHSWLAASLPLLAISGCEILLQNTDVLVLSRYTTPHDVAIYFAAGKTMSLIMFVHYAVGSAVANRFASFKERGDDVGLRASVRGAVNLTFWPSLVAALVILGLGRPLLSLFGPEFVDGYPVMAILVLGFLARSAMGPAEFLLNMLGEQRRCATVMAIAATLNIGLNLLLVPRYGIVGAASATAAALITAALLNAWVARAKLGIKVAIWHNLPTR
jgi:O-antigen/teichoic acid export membrane protein